MPRRMNLRSCVALSLVAIPWAASLAAAEPKGPANRLAKETSPYLLLHAHNPVDWYPVGPRGVRQGQGREQADLPVDRLQLVLLVPRHGARVLQGPRDRQAPERAVRLHQGRPRGAARRRPDLHDRAPGVRQRRLADVDVPDPRRPPLLRRDLFPPQGPRGHARVPDDPAGGGRGLARRTAGGREGGRPARRGRPPHDRRRGPERPGARLACGGRRGPCPAGRAVRPRVRRVRLLGPRTPAGPSSPSPSTSSSSSTSTAATRPGPARAARSGTRRAPSRWRWS